MKSFSKGLVHTLVAMTFLGGVASLQGCNMWGKLDSSQSAEEKVTDAQAKIENDDCPGAVDDLEAIPEVERNDKVYQMLGWAYLCKGGATVKRIGKSLLAYDINSTSSLSVVAGLVNDLIPADASRVQSIGKAITYFSKQTNREDKLINEALANMVYAAAVLARASNNGINVKRADIGRSNCLAQTCSSAPAGCDASGILTDADMNDIGSKMVAASNKISELKGLSSSSTGAVGSLADRLGAFAGTSGTDTAKAAITRCNIYNSVFTQ